MADVAAPPEVVDHDQAAPPRDTSAVVLAVVCGAVAVLAGTFVIEASIDRSVLVIAVGVLLGGGLAMLAITRFAAFVIVLVAVRAALDGLKLSGFGGSAITEPGVLVGGVLLVASMLWLLAQRSADRLVPFSRTARWLCAFALIGLLSSLGAADRAGSVQAAIRIVASALSFVVLEQLLARRPALIRGLLVAAGLSIVVPAFVALEQMLGADELYTYSTVSRVQGTFVHPNSFGAYLVIVAVAAVAISRPTSGWTRRAALVCAVVASVLVLFTYARGAWLALVFGAGYLLVKHHRGLLLGLVAGGAALVLLVPSVGSRLSDLNSSPPSTEIGDGTANSLEWRIAYWQEILPLWQENPITGIGLDQVPERTAAHAEPHSAFVQSIVETGLLGFVALVGFVVSLWRDLGAARRRATSEFDRWMALGATAVAAGFLLQMFTENLLTQVAIHLYLWIPVAYATSMLRRPAKAAAPHADVTV